MVIKCEKTILDSNRIRVDVASHADVLRGSSSVSAPREV